jgi:hypothetical protein
LDVKTAGLWLVISLGILVGGCGSSISTSYDYDVNARFEDYRTYDWAPVPETAPKNAKQAMQRNDLLDKRIRNAVDARLAEKGLTRDTKSPDLLVVYHLGIEDKVQVTDWGYRYSDYYWGYGGRDIDVYNYKEGTLMIDLVDANTHQLVWRGAAQKPLDEKSSPEKAEQTINNVVGKILSQYPPNR